MFQKKTQDYGWVSLKGKVMCKQSGMGLMAPTMENYTNFFLHSAVRAGLFQKAFNMWLICT